MNTLVLRLAKTALLRESGTKSPYWWSHSSDAEQGKRPQYHPHMEETLIRNSGRKTGKTKTNPRIALGETSNSMYPVLQRYDADKEKSLKPATTAF